MLLGASAMNFCTGVESKKPKTAINPMAERTTIDAAAHVGTRSFSSQRTGGRNKAENKNANAIGESTSRAKNSAAPMATMAMIQMPIVFELLLSSANRRDHTAELRF